MFDLFEIAIGRNSIFPLPAVEGATSLQDMPTNTPDQKEARL